MNKKGALSRPLLNNGNATQLIGCSCRTHGIIAGNDTPQGSDREFSGFDLYNWEPSFTARDKEEPAGPIGNIVLSLFQHYKGAHHPKTTYVPSTPLYIMG